MTNKQTHIKAVVHTDAEKQPLHYSCTKEHSTLQEAAIHGDSERTKELISVYDPKANDSYALRLAAEHGQIECVKLLIPVSDPKAKDSEALLMAVRYGYEDIVKLLIPVSDPKANDSMALTWAVRFGYKQCILPLIPVSDLSWVFNNLNKSAQKELLHQCIEEYEITQQHNRLEEQIASATNKTSVATNKRKL